MFQKKLTIVALAALFTTLSLNAAYMDRVNEIVLQMKGAQGIVAPVVEKPVAVVAPVVKEVAVVAEPVVKEVVPVVAAVVKEAVTVAEVTPEPVATVVNTVTEESLGLRKTNLYTESDTTGDATTYGKAAAGTSTKFERAFENAPPMIPHDVEGMLPIKIGNNACTGCHMPEVAPSMGATPIPGSHFASFRPITSIGVNGEVIKEGKAVENTSDLKTVVHKLEKLSNSRFSCSQCHAPQSTQAPLVENTFKPDFSKDGKKSSNLLDTINEGVN